MGGISLKYCNKRNIQQNETDIKQGFKTHIGEVGKEKKKWDSSFMGERIK